MSIMKKFIVFLIILGTVFGCNLVMNHYSNYVCAATSAPTPVPTQVGPTPYIKITYNIEKVSDASENGLKTGQFHVWATQTGTIAGDGWSKVYYTITGTATNGVDYQTLQGYVYILVGYQVIPAPTDAPNTYINITPILDSAIEGSETVTLTLQSANVGSGSATVNLEDLTEVLPTPTPTPPPYTSIVVYGYVYDNNTGTGIAGAQVRMDTSATTTDDTGYYLVSHVFISGTPSAYLTVMATGYQTQSGSASGGRKDFYLVPLATPTPIITATPTKTATPRRTVTPRRTATPRRTPTPRITATPTPVSGLKTVITPVYSPGSTEFNVVPSYPGTTIVAKLTDQAGNGIAGQTINWSATLAYFRINNPTSVTDSTGTAITTVIVPADAGLDIHTTMTAGYAGNSTYAASSCPINIHVYSPGFMTAPPTRTPSTPTPTPVITATPTITPATYTLFVAIAMPADGSSTGSPSIILDPPGTPVGTPGTFAYQPGTIVTLTANGAGFSSWSGALTGNQNPATITMDGNKSVYALYAGNMFGSLKLQLYNGNTSAITNMLSPNFRITNPGTAPLVLSTVKIRYYFTVNGDVAQNFYCDYSQVGSANITGAFVKLATPKVGADYYLEIGFNNAAGSLVPGASIDIQTRIAKSDWTHYTQTDDYSFNATATTYVDWTKITGYISGMLRWGIEP